MISACLLVARGYDRATLQRDHTKIAIEGKPQSKEAGKGKIGFVKFRDQARGIAQGYIIILGT